MPVKPTGSKTVYPKLQARTGQSIGLFGGSFNPAHEGHAHITRAALKWFGLDQIWWLVSPQNPLKEKQPQSFSSRIAKARSLMQHPRVQITDIEQRLETHYTVDTLRKLKQHHTTVRFVWLMGGDSLSNFHHWYQWKDICAQMPIGVLARPDHTLKAQRSKQSYCYRKYRIRQSDAQSLKYAKAPAWCYVTIPLSEQSSTHLREIGQWPAPSA